MFGSNPQALQVTQVMTDRPCRAIKVGRIQVRFFVKRGIEQTPTQQLTQASAPLNISTPEATALDLIRYATSIGGIERASETIAPLLHRITARELKRSLEVMNEPAIAQRLGFVVEAAGAKKTGSSHLRLAARQAAADSSGSGPRGTQKHSCHRTLAGSQ